MTLTLAVPIETKTQSDQPETFEGMFGGLWVPEDVFLSAFQGLLNFPKILISDHFAALFGILPPQLIVSFSLSSFGSTRARRTRLRPSGGACCHARVRSTRYETHPTLRFQLTERIRFRRIETPTSVTNQLSVGAGHDLTA